MEHHVPIQSLIDHIKTATDVDPWAKEWAEVLIKKSVPILPKIEPDIRGIKYACGACNATLWIQKDTASLDYNINYYNYCTICGQAVKK